MRPLLALLACPSCRGALTDAWSCRGCGAQFAAADGIPNLRIGGDARTDAVRRFYERAPFPGYPPRDSLQALRARAERNAFVHLLDRSIAGDARIVEIGCGTGQLSLYLARAARLVIGADLTRASLQLGAAAATRFGLTERVQFIETDLRQPALMPAAFDLVYASGVLHHTPDPRASFAAIASLARSGGVIVVGVYNTLARMPTRVRRVAARWSMAATTRLDPVLRARRDQPARYEAWQRDQYCHPEEHTHTLAEVRRWFAENGVDYLRSYPSSVEGDDPDDLFAPAADDWAFEAWLAQLGWMWTLGGEGGLFITIGRKQSRMVNGES